MAKSRATQAEKKRRIDLIIQALIRNISEDHIVEMLKKQGLSYRQARRYMDMAYEALCQEAVEQDPIQVGLILKRAKQTVDMAHHQALEQQDNPDGRAIRNSMAAQKGFVAIKKAFTAYKQEMKSKSAQQKKKASDAEEAVDIFKLLGMG